MKITIDNFAGTGPAEYTAALDPTVAPRVERKINEPAELRCTLLGGSSGFVIPAAGARIAVIKENGKFLFTGYLTQAPECEYLGWSQSGPVYRYRLVAASDEVLLDQKALPTRAPFVVRSAGSALKQLAEDSLPGGFDTTSVLDVDVLASYQVNPQKKFSYHAGEIALAARASYRAMNGAIVLNPLEVKVYSIDENDTDYSPSGLQLASPAVAINDVTAIGLVEPQAYVRDYFVGDGLSLRFYLSQIPFQQNRRALIDESYLGPALDPATWRVSDPASAVSVATQTLQVSGGNGQDGSTTVAFLEQIELGGALELQHGDVSFAAGSQGIIGGIYPGEVSSAGCLAGFQVTPSGSGSKIQALINGSPVGPTVTTISGHRYLFTTYVYSMEVYRSQQTYHSSQHAAGSGRDGAAVPANVRFVLEVQDINPSVAASMVAPATVLYDDVILNGPGFCTYALVDAANMQCSIANTYVTRISTAEVRTALANEPYKTQLVESLSEGGECAIVSSTTLDFYPRYVPPLNTLIVASYRGSGRAVAQIVNSSAITDRQSGADDGVRSIVKTIKAPSARTRMDCENAALAILDDANGPAWIGTYRTWSDFLPGKADDIFPGDGVAVNAPSQNAVFNAIVRKVGIELADPANERGMYTIEFANDLAQPPAMEEEATATAIPIQHLPVRLATGEVDSYYLPSLTNAQITDVSSTTVQVDAGEAPQNGGIEVRIHDFGWGSGNDRNLLGRFSSQHFSLPRLARSQNYFLRLYDNSSPPRYSRYAAALHVDYPYE